MFPTRDDFQFPVQLTRGQSDEHIHLIIRENSGENPRPHNASQYQGLLIGRVSDQGEKSALFRFTQSFRIGINDDKGTTQFVKLPSDDLADVPYPQMIAWSLS